MGRSGTHKVLYEVKEKYKDWSLSDISVLSDGSMQIILFSRCIDDVQYDLTGMFTYYYKNIIFKPLCHNCCYLFNTC